MKWCKFFWLLVVVEAMEQSCISRILDSVVLYQNHVYYYNEPGFFNDFVPSANLSYTLFDVNVPETLFFNSVYTLIASCARCDLKSVFNYIFRTDKPMLVLVLYHGNSEGMLQIFEFLWSYYVADVLVLVGDELYTYYPISQDACKTVVLQLLGTCTNISSYRKESDSLVFRGCPFYVQAMVHPPYVSNDGYEENWGFEVRILRVLVAKLQMEPVFVNYGYSKDFPEPLHQLFEISLTGAVPIDAKFAYYYLYEPVSFYMLKTGAEEPWKNTLLIYDGLVWIFLLVSCFFVALVCQLVNSDARLDTNVLLVVSALISSIPSFPKVLNGVVLVWSTAALLLVNAYTGLLTSFLFKEIPKRQPRTFREILDAGYDYGGTWVSQRFFHGEEADIYTNNYFECPFDVDLCMERLLAGKFAYIRTGHGLMYYSKSNNLDIFYKAPAIVNSYLGAPLFDTWYDRRIKDCMLRMNEGGIVQHLDEYQWRQMDVVLPKFTVITLSYLYFIFVVCALGILGALFVFLLELFWARKLEKANK